jgi:hypothetical protein
MEENPFNRPRDRRREPPPEVRAAPVVPPVSGPALPSVEINPFNNPKQVGIRAPLAPGEVDWSQMGKPYGEIKSHEWSPTERMAYGIQDALMAGGMQADPARHLGKGLIDTVRLNPLVNAVTSGFDLTHHAPRGEYVNSAFDALGVLPFVGTYAPKFVRGQTAVRDADIPRSALDKSWLPERQLFGKPDQYGMRPGGSYGPALPSSSRPIDENRLASARSYSNAASTPVQWQPNSLNDYILRAVNELRAPGMHGTPHIPENSPEFYGVMTRWYNNHVGRATPVTATEWDALRQELRSLQGPSGIAGSKAADRLDTYTQHPPGGLASGTQQELDAYRGHIEDARGNWRTYKTASTVEQALVDAKNSARVNRTDEGSAVQSVLDRYANTPAGREAIFGASPHELATIGQAAQGTTGNWLLNKVGDIGMSGKAAGLGGTLGGSLGGALGLDWGTAAAMASAGAGAPLVAGGIARWGARPGMAKSAQEALDEIRMNSPLYRDRVQGTPAPPPQGFMPYGGASAPGPLVGGRPPVDNPNIMARDAIAYALMPQVQREGQDIWAGADAPFEPKIVPQPPSPRRIIIDQPAESWDPLLGEQR